MFKLKIIAKLIKWVLRFVFFIVISFVIIDFGVDKLYALVSSTIFMIFYMWYFWTLDYDEPIIEWDEDK